MIGNGLALNYLLLIFGSSVGMLQIAATWGGIKGLSFLRNRVLNYLLGLVVLCGTYVWFFSTANLRMPHPDVEGAQQLVFFLLGAFCAVLFTFLFSSLIHSRALDEAQGTSEGLEGFKELTPFQVIGRLRRKGR